MSRKRRPNGLGDFSLPATRLLTAKELADALRVSGSTVKRMVREDRIPYVRIKDGRGALRFHGPTVLRALMKVS